MLSFKECLQLTFRKCLVTQILLNCVFSILATMALLIADIHKSVWSLLKRIRCSSAVALALLLLLVQLLVKFWKCSYLQCNKLPQHSVLMQYNCIYVIPRPRLVYFSVQQQAVMSSVINKTSVQLYNIHLFRAWSTDIVYWVVFGVFWRCLTGASCLTFVAVCT